MGIDWAAEITLANQRLMTDQSSCLANKVVDEGEIARGTSTGKSHQVHGLLVGDLLSRELEKPFVNRGPCTAEVWVS